MNIKFMTKNERKKDVKLIMNMKFTNSKGKYTISKRTNKKGVINRKESNNKCENYLECANVKQRLLFTREKQARI